jgi:uncharacterized protein involved in exopolysaccharide biosynthesis
MGITPEGHGQGILDKQQLQQLPQQMKNIMALTQQWHGGEATHEQQYQQLQQLPQQMKNKSALTQQRHGGGSNT